MVRNILLYEKIFQCSTFFYKCLKIEEKSNNKKKSKEKSSGTPNFDSFLEDYFSIILSQLISLKVKDGIKNSIDIFLKIGKIKSYFAIR